MFRRKKGGFGILMQMTLGLLAAFLASGVLLYLAADRQLEKSREEQISRELQTIREDTGIYVRQLLVLNDANNDAESFGQLVEDIVQEKAASGRYEMAAYTRDGRLLADSLETGIFPEDGEQAGDLREAVRGNTAFSMVYGNERLEVWFSMPVIVAEKNIGIIRYRMDYTDLWRQGREIEEVLLKTAAMVSAITFLLILLLVNGILRPIRRLTKVSRQMSMDLEQNQVNIRLLAGLADSRRRDEVGELSRNYRVMLEKTGQFIGKMQSDRERILALMNSRQEFYNNVTHELKTPLTTIQGYAQLIEADGGQDDALLQKGIGHILHESTRLHKMVLQLLEMADREKPDAWELVDVNALIRGVAEAMEIKANRYQSHISLHLEEGCILWGQEARLRQVFINLIDNAVKYGETGGKIHICSKKGKEGLLIFVASRGKELAPEELTLIFEPFYRLDKEYAREQGSAGLGLSICRKIMEEHGGKIWAESGRDGETIFFLSFPEKKGGKTDEQQR